MKNPSKSESGQALLLVLLSMAVVLTIVLSILARSTLDIGISSRSEESVRAFSAAEAGIEQALVAGSLSGTFSNATFDASVSGFASGQGSFNLPESIYSGDNSNIWFVSHDASGNLLCDIDNPCFTGSSLQVCWGLEASSSDSSTTPAVEVSIFYLNTPGVYSTARVAREAIDPNSSRRGSNSFIAPDSGSCTINGKVFPFQKTLDFSSLGIPAGVYGTNDGLQFAIISILYNTDMGHPVGVNGVGSIFPSQGTKIDSTGVAGSSTRKVEVFRGYSLPAVDSGFVGFIEGEISK